MVTVRHHCGLITAEKIALEFFQRPSILPTMTTRAMFNLRLLLLTFALPLAAIGFTSCGGNGDAEPAVKASAKHHYTIAMTGVV